MSTSTRDFDYASLLPESLRSGNIGSEPGEDSASVVARLLSIIDPMFDEFDALLTDVSDQFDPLLASEEFLPWLASWTALVLRADWSLEQKRKALSQIIPLYRKRGTKAGLEEYLKIYVGEGVSIFDEHVPMQVGSNATVGEDTIVGGLPAHYFRATVAFTTPNPAELASRTESVRAVLDIEKPAHTSYILTTSGPTFQIDVHSTVGMDTLI